MISTKTPIPIAPTISPTPNDTIASIPSSNYSAVGLSSSVSEIIGTNSPVYTEMLIPVQHNYGIIGLILFETKSTSTALISFWNELSFYRFSNS